ncbi:MAG: hypothetical protein GY866_33870, partial [Proteobacteria bacterium]|nr:hypothetical protein [Pseudomonadota bacterium]
MFKSGIGPFSRTDLIKRLIFKNIRGETHIDYYEQGLIGSASPEDVEVLFQVSRLALTQPGFEREVFEEEKRNLVERIQKQQETAYWKFRQACLTELFA